MPTIERYVHDVGAGTPAKRRAAVRHLLDRSADEDEYETVAAAVMSTEGALDAVVNDLQCELSKAALHAAGLLENLAHVAEMKDAIVTAGAVPMLVYLLEWGCPSASGVPAARTQDAEVTAGHAAGVLCNVLNNDSESNFAAVFTQRAVEALAEMLERGADNQAAKKAADALHNLAEPARWRNFLHAQPDLTISAAKYVLDAFDPDMWAPNAPPDPTPFPELVALLRDLAQLWSDDGRRYERLYALAPQAATITVQPIAMPIVDDGNVPSEYVCPITHVPMTDPVLLLGDGVTYERAAISRWLEVHRGTSPSSNVRLAEEISASCQT